MLEQGPQALPSTLMIVTDMGRSSKEQGNCIVKEAVNSMMAFWQAPFKCVVALGTAAVALIYAPGAIAMQLPPLLLTVSNLFAAAVCCAGLHKIACTLPAWRLLVRLWLNGCLARISAHCWLACSQHPTLTRWVLAGGALQKSSHDITLYAPVKPVSTLTKMLVRGRAVC